MKLMVGLIVALCAATTAFAGENLGRIDSTQELMRIGGNNNREREQYNFVVVLRLRAQGEHFRAISDVEARAGRAGDVLHRIASIDNLVIATIRSPGNHGNVQSSYASASRLTSLWGGPESWAYGERTTKVVFGERPPTSLCN